MIIEGSNGTSYIITGIIALLFGLVFYVVDFQVDPLTPNVFEFVEDVLIIMLILVGTTLLPLGIGITLSNHKKL